MASSRQLASGRHLTAILLKLGTIGSDGTLTAGSTAGTDSFTLTNKSTFVGFLEDVEFDLEQNTDDGTVLGSPSDNDIPTTTRHSITLTEPLRYTNGNILAAAMMNAISNADGTTGTPYAQVTITRAGKSFTFWGLMKGYRESYRKNKLVGVMTLSMVDVGSANPTYA